MRKRRSVLDFEETNNGRGTRATGFAGQRTSRGRTPHGHNRMHTTMALAFVLSFTLAACGDDGEPASGTAAAASEERASADDQPTTDDSNKAPQAEEAAGEDSSDEGCAPFIARACEGKSNGCKKKVREWLPEAMKGPDGKTPSPDEMQQLCAQVFTEEKVVEAYSNKAREELEL